MRVVFRLIAAASLLLPPVALAQAVTEYELKAAFVFNFALFTDWPAETTYEGGLFHVCVSPSSPMRESLSGIVGKIVKGRRLTLRATTGTESLRSCHVLVLDGGDRERWAQVRAALGSAPVLTVTDDDLMARDGAIVALLTDGQRPAFDINLKMARQANLVLSSKLLRLARMVN